MTSLDSPRFDGARYDAAFDFSRLKGQLRRIYDHMSDQRWHTLGDIERATGAPKSSVLAQFGNLRKLTFEVACRPTGDRAAGRFQYRLNPAPGSWVPQKQPCVARGDFYARYANDLAAELRRLDPGNGVLNCWDWDERP